LLHIRVFRCYILFFFFSSRRRHTRSKRDWSSDVCSSDLNHDKRSEKILHLVSKPTELITSILIGNNIANILLPTLVTTLAIQYGMNVALASALLTVMIIVFAEVIPKSIAAAFPNRI